MKESVSAIVAWLLLALYGYSVYSLIKSRGETSEQIKIVLSTVGALVSALITSVLITAPELAAAGKALIGFENLDPNTVQALMWAYVSVWLICGMALMVSWMRTDKPHEALRNAATTWLGLAVAIAYALFGLKQV